MIETIWTIKREVLTRKCYSDIVSFHSLNLKRHIHVKLLTVNNIYIETNIWRLIKIDIKFKHVIEQ